MSRSNSIAGFRSASETSTCAPTTNASGIIDENSHISSLRVPKGHENSIPNKENSVWDRALFGIEHYPFNRFANASIRALHSFRASPYPFGLMFGVFK
jgi:hypothetical protein